MAEKVKEQETEVEEPTPTPEEQMESLKTQLAEATEKATTAEAVAEEKTKGFKRIQRQLSEKQKIVPRASTSGTAQALQEVISAMEAQASEAGEMNLATQTKLTLARQHLATVERQAAYEKEDAITAEVTVDLRNELIEAGVDPDSAQCDTVWDAVRIARMDNGNFDSAKSRSGRIIKNAKPKEDTVEVKPEDEEKRINDLADAKALEILKKTPGFKTHEGVPSGSTGTFNIVDLKGKDLTSLTKKERAEWLKAFSDGAVNTK